MNDFIAECTTSFDKNNSRLYSMDNGKLIKELINSEKYPVYDLISWYNKENNEYYIIQIGLKAIVITNLLLDDEIYFKFKIDANNIYHKGILYENNESDYLFSMSIQEQFIIIELYSLTIIKKIYISLENIVSNNIYPSLNSFILWNNKYLIFNFKYNPFYYIYDLEEDKIIFKITISSNSKPNIKRIYLPTYGESLLIRDNANIIKLWSV